MGKGKNPRHGSLAFWPRKRSRKEVPKLRAIRVPKDVKLGGFPGYKVGMVTAQYIDNRKKATTAGDLIGNAATLIECPPVKIYSVRYYKRSPYGLKIVTEVVNPKLDKELGRRVDLAKNSKRALLENLEGIDLLRVIIYSQPKLTGFGKKIPDLVELAVGGTKEQQLAYVKEKLDKEITVKDVFKEGQQMDVHGITQGHGIQGPIRRYGIHLRSHKSQKSRRFAVLSTEGLSKVMYTAHQQGNLGYALRTEYNKWLIKIVDNVSNIKNMKHYGDAKNTCMLVKGSVPGPQKRYVLFTESKRATKKIASQAPEFRGM
jgi:large subunit ribosomal protein L3